MERKKQAENKLPETPQGVEQIKPVRRSNKADDRIHNESEGKDKCWQCAGLNICKLRGSHTFYLYSQIAKNPYKMFCIGYSQRKGILFEIKKALGMVEQKRFAGKSIW